MNNLPKLKRMLIGAIMLWFIGMLIVGSIVANVVTFLNPNFDQLDVFHTFKQTYSMLDWNVPHILDDVDVDGDGISDTLTFDGCILLSRTNPTIIPQSKTCTSSLVNKGETKGWQVENVDATTRTMFLGQAKNGKWHVVKMGITTTNLYEINLDGSITEKNVPLALQINTWIYLYTHILLFLIP